MSAHEQHPIVTGFGAASDAAAVMAGVDLAGRVALVTGGFPGLGARRSRPWPPPVPE